MRAIVRHHCGDHSLCEHEKFCSYLQVKHKHPNWSPKQVELKWMKQSKRQILCMDLSAYGIKVLEEIIGKRFNENTIDRIAKCGCSNSCEGFWSKLVKLSEGKRIQGSGADLWQSMVQLCYCMSGPGKNEQAREELSHVMNVFVTPHEKQHSWTSRQNREQNYERHGSKEGKRRKQLARLTRDHCSGKDKNKSYHHKTEKCR